MPGTAGGKLGDGGVQRRLGRRRVAVEKRRHAAVKQHCRCRRQRLPLATRFLESAPMPGKRGFLIIPARTPFRRDRRIVGGHECFGCLNVLGEPQGAQRHQRVRILLLQGRLRSPGDQLCRGRARRCQLSFRRIRLRQHLVKVAHQLREVADAERDGDDRIVSGHELGPLRRGLARRGCFAIKGKHRQAFIPGQLRIKRLHGARFVGGYFALQGCDPGGLCVGLFFEIASQQIAQSGLYGCFVRHGNLPITDSTHEANVGPRKTCARRHAYPWTNLLGRPPVHRSA